MKAIMQVVAGILVILLFSSGCSSPGYSSSPLIKEARNEDQFMDEVYYYEGTVAVMFYTVACPVCRKIKPLMKNIAEKWKKEIKIVTVNCRTNTDLIMEYKINATPRFIFFEDGEQITEATRINSEEELFDLFEKHSG